MEGERDFEHCSRGFCLKMGNCPKFRCQRVLCRKGSHAVWLHVGPQNYPEACFNWNQLERMIHTCFELVSCLCPFNMFMSCWVCFNHILGSPLTCSLRSWGTPPVHRGQALDMVLKSAAPRVRVAGCVWELEKSPCYNWLRLHAVYNIVIVVANKWYIYNHIYIYIYVQPT